MQLTRSLSLPTVLTAALCVLAPPPSAQDVDEDYARAYVLENEERDFAAAARLYERIVDDPRASAAVRQKAEARLAGCREELACSDFAGLMPKSPLAYVELNRPGDQLEALLEELGLLQMAHQAAGEGSGTGVSPALVQGLLGMRGAAVAVTGVNPVTGQPTGVAVLHPGDLDLVRGLIETALPSGAEPAGGLHGFPTYDLHGQGFVTLTSRLVVASTHKREITRVLGRIDGTEPEALADNGLLIEAMGERERSLLTLCLNPGPLVPLVKMAAAQEREAAMALEVCDPESLETIVGRLRVRDGISLDLAVNLEEGHESLAFDLLRMPPIQRDTLARVPEGAAAFVAASLNEVRHYDTHGGGDAYVSLMDVGRELFGNIASLALFALPPEGQTNGGPRPMPRLGAVVTVNDPAKTAGLWHTVLGLCSMASGGASLEGEKVEVAGTTAHRYAMPEGLAVYGAVAGHELHLAMSRSTLAASLGTRGGRPSVLDDSALESALRRVDASSSFAFAFHAGRCLQAGKAWAPRSEAQEIERVLPHLSRAAGSAVISHGPSRLRVSLGVSGLPDVGKLMAERRRQEQQHGDAGDRGEHEGHAHAAESSPAPHGGAPKSRAELLAAFEQKAVQKGSRSDALAVFEDLYPHLEDDAFALNNLAWRLMTESRYGGRYDELALRLARRSNELSRHGRWEYVDTLALATFRAGDVARAIELERLALELAGDDVRREELEAALERFEAARDSVASEAR